MSQAIVSTRRCTHCGYDLNGLFAPCPECNWPSELYTDRAREVAALANQFAKGAGAANRYRLPRVRWLIRPVHLALGIVRGPDGVAKHVLALTGVALDSLAERLLAASPRVLGEIPTQKARLPWSRTARKLIEFDAPDIARESGHSWIGSEHLLLALLRSGPKETVRCFAEHGAKFAAVLDAVLSNNAGYHPHKTS